MTRGSFIALLTMGAVVVALGIGYFELDRKVDARLGDGPTIAANDETDGSPVADRETRSALRGLQNQLDQYRETNTERVGKLEEKLAKLEAQAALVTRGVAGETPVAAGPIPSDLESQVNQILEQRAQAKQKEDSERRAGRMTDFFLREMTVTPEQRKQFTSIVAAYWDARGKVSRERYPNAEDRRVAMEALAAERNQKLQQIFDAGQMTQLTERLDRMGRGGPGNRRPGGGGGGRGR